MHMDDKQEKVKRIAASLDLQKRVGTGIISESEVKRAQQVIDTNEVDFAPIARPYLKEINALVSSALSSGDYAALDLKAFSKPVMNLKANAATFKYQLVSDLTGTVLFFLESLAKADKKVLQIIDLLHKTLLLVVAREMKGDGGKDGQALYMAFSELCRTYKPKD